MNDTLFERDLRSVLLDMAPADVPAALRDVVAAVPRTHPMSAPDDRIHSRRRFIAFVGIAAVIAVAVIGLAFALGGRFNGNVAGPSPVVPELSPSTAASSAGTDWVEVTFALADAPSSSTATRINADIAVLRRRLEAIGVSELTLGGTSSGGIAVTMPNEWALLGVSAALTTGVVEFVPMDSPEVTPGETIDLAQHKPLFGNDGVAGSKTGIDGYGGPTLDLDFTSTAAATMRTWSAAHVGSTLAIVVDGKVAFAPFIQSPIANGSMQVSFHSGDGVVVRLPVLVVALNSGPLPYPLVETSRRPVPAPANPWVPSSSVAPTPAPSPTSDRPAASGVPATVGTPWRSLDVTALAGPVPTSPQQVVAWAHGYLLWGAETVDAPTAVWSSADGRSWTAWPDGMLGLGLGAATVAGMAPCRDGVMVLAATSDSLDAGVTTDGHTWRTQPIWSKSWTRTVLPMAGGPGGAVIAEVKSKVLHVTTDCSTWSTITLDAPDNTVVTGVAALGNGFVATGFVSGNSAADTRAIAFRSPDGTTWTPADVLSAAGHAFQGSPAAASGGLVVRMVVAFASPDPVALYHSVDGTWWSPMQDPPLGTVPGEGPQGIFVGDGRQILAYGSLGGNAATLRMYWVSTDGSAWHALLVNGALFTHGTGADKVTAPDSSASYRAFLLRDGILFVGVSDAFVGAAQ